MNNLCESELRKGFFERLRRVILVENFPPQKATRSEIAIRFQT